MAYQPKSYRKFVATAATATLVASAIAPIASAADASKFTDVSEKYKEAVEFVVLKGAHGLTETTFGTNANIKRVDAAVLLVNVLGLDIEDAPASGFKDVPTRAVKHINALKEAKIATGKNSTTFDSNSEITRGELAKWIQNAFDLKATSKNQFKDVTGHYTEAVTALVDNGVTFGETDTTFGTYSNAKRGDYAQFLLRASKAIEVGPVVQSIKHVDADTVILTIKGELKEVKASDFKFDNNLEVKDAKIVAAPKVAADTLTNVELTTSTQKDGQKYTLTEAFGKLVDPAKAPSFTAPAGAQVESVSAANGKLTVKFTKAPEAVPTLNDFKVTRNINGTTKAVDATSVAWDSTTNTATLVVGNVSATEVDQTVSYSVGYKETPYSTSNSFVIAKVVEVKVESVKALNSTQIQVVYNQEMDRASVTNLDSYTLSDNPNAARPSYKAFDKDDNGKYTSSASLQDDKKTVIITLAESEKATSVITNGVLHNKKAHGLQVDSTKVKSVTDKVLEENARVVFTLEDNSAPVVAATSITESGNLVITFNERVATPGQSDTTKKITVNGHTFTSTDLEYSYAAGRTSVVIKKAKLIDANKARLETGKNYVLNVGGQVDVYGNTMTDVYSSTFTYSPAQDAPKFVSAAAYSEKAFILKFSEPVTLVSGTSLAVQINKGAKQLTTSSTSYLGDNEYLVTLSDGDLSTDLLYDRAKNETSVTLDVYLPAIKDGAGNITAESRTTVTLKKDVTKPALAKTSSTGNLVSMAFTEGVTAVGTLAEQSYVLNAAGVKITVDAADLEWVNGVLTYKSSKLSEGNYTFVIQQGALKDSSLNGGNVNDEIRASFVVGEGLLNKPLIKTVDASTNSGVFVITFDKPITYASAANYQNYSVDGTIIPDNSKFSLSKDRKTLTIELPEASFKETKDRLISIKGVRNDNNILMDDYKVISTVKENEKIKLLSAAIVNGDIILTFNENVNDTTLSVDFDKNDFAVKVEGTLTTIADVIDHDDDTDTNKVGKNQLKIKAPIGVSFATGNVTVEVIKDTVNNPVTIATDQAGNTVLIDGKVIAATR